MNQVMLAARTAAPSPIRLTTMLTASTTGTTRRVGSHSSRHCGSLRNANASSSGTRKKSADAMPLAFAFRRLPQWRDLWLPTLLVVPVVLAVSIVFSLIGDGAAVRAASITWFIWLGLVAWRLLRVADNPARTTHTPVRTPERGGDQEPRRDDGWMESAAALLRH